MFTFGIIILPSILLSRGVKTLSPGLLIICIIIVPVKNATVNPYLLLLQHILNYLGPFVNLADVCMYQFIPVRCIFANSVVNGSPNIPSLNKLC